MKDFRQRHPPRHLLVHGVDWEYLALGQGQETLLFLSGLAGGYDIWWQQISALQDSYQIISVTYPPVRGLGEMARGLLAILDHQQVRQVTVVGTSFGGYLAQYLLAVHPERVTQAVLSNTYANCALIKEKFWLVGLLLPYAPEKLVKAVLRLGYRWIIFPTSRRSVAVLEYLNELTRTRTSKAQIETRYQAVIEPCPRPEPSQGTPRLLIIESDNDPLIEPHVREDMRRAYPGAAMHTFHAAGHFPYLVVPQEYSRVLVEFIAG